MDDALVQQIYDSEPMRQFELAASRGAWLDKLVNEVKNAVPEVAACDPVDLRMVVAMIPLGPDEAGTPPRAMRQELLEIIGRHMPEQDRIARRGVYNCVWRREVAQTALGRGEHMGSQVAQRDFATGPHVPSVRQDRGDLAKGQGAGL